MATTIATDQIGVSGVAVGTYGPVSLLGGYYSLAVSTLTGTTPSAQLQKLMADGSTANVGSAITTAGAYNIVQLSPGLFQLVITGTGVSAEVAVSKIKGGV